MERSATAIALCVALSALAACAGARARQSAKELSRHELSVAGVERHYYLYEPDKRFSGTRPLLIVLHGGGGTALGIAREAGASFHALADEEGFYVAYPNALNKIWDFGAGKVSRELEVRVDDRSFFEKLLLEIPERNNIDTSRIFATGISRGGQASYFLACAFPGQIRAIAPVTMPLPSFMVELCRDAPPVGVAILNGTEDPLVPYEGGDIQLGRRKRGEVLSTAATVAFWRARNGCSDETPSRERINRARDRMHVDKISWRECRGAPVVLYRIEGGGHTWPSGRQYLPRFLVGRVNRDIDGAREIWSFFREFE